MPNKRLTLVFCAYIKWTGIEVRAYGLSVSFLNEMEVRVEFIFKYLGYAIRALVVGFGLSISATTVWAGPVSAGLSATGATLTPHQAVYKMTLSRADQQSGLIGAGGAMTYKLSDSCDGWTAETNVYLRFSYSEGQQIETNWAFASWEARDGLHYRYRMKQTRDGEVLEEIKGEARRKTIDGPGQAVFSVPKDTVIDLPKDFMFPARHLMAVLNKASSGGKIINRFVFDGASLDNPYEINAIISRGKTPALKRIRMAFYPIGSEKPIPEFELAADYRPDGIADYIQQDFGDFTLDLVPEKIEILDRPDC